MSESSRAPGRRVTERTEERSEYRCGPAARWLPRTLGAAVLVGAILAAYRFDHGSVLTASKYLKVLVIVMGAALALWIVRRGAEVRTVVATRGEELVFRHGSREYSMRIEDLDRFDYETPFAQSRTWLPALVLRDRFGQPWRVPALLEEGDRFVDDLLRLSSRSDLQAWSETLRLSKRMGHAGSRILIGYLVAAALLASGLIFHFRG